MPPASERGGWHFYAIKEVVRLIVVRASPGKIEINGHAGYAESGKDIVCAAVSILAQNLVRSLEELTRDSVYSRVEQGHINIEFGNLSEQGGLLVDSFFIGICAVANAYGPEYVRIM